MRAGILPGITPYVGWGHCLQPEEKYSAHTMTRQQADELLRKDLRKFCAMFEQFGKDSLLLSKFRIKSVIQTKILSQLDFYYIEYQ